MSLAQSTSDFAVETVEDILTNIPLDVGGYGNLYGLSYGTKEQTWHNDTRPEIYQWQDVPQKSKENNPDPAVYIWSPTDTDLTEFSADGTQFEQSDTVECQVWALDGATCRKYARDIVDIVGQYMRDNKEKTRFHQIIPQSINDARAEQTNRKTDHYINVVTIQLEDFRQADLRN